MEVGVGEVLSGQVTYADAGVDLEADLEGVRRIWEIARRTIGGDRVLGHVGPFCATVKLDDQVIVASVDGLGTKSRILSLLDRYEVAGQDIVNHGVNDILTSGASPLFFLDYIGGAKLTVDQKERIVRGIADACMAVDCPLVGGETAMMPGIYKADDFDLVGFIVGTVRLASIIDGSKVREGDLIFGLPSTGLHTNGYSLVRKVFGVGMEGDEQEERARLERFYPEINTTLGEALAAPHRCYYNDLKPLLSKVTGIAHITGHGLPGNVLRPLPDGEDLGVRIDKSSWKVPPIFELIQERGNIAEDEMFSVFNMGIGITFFVRPSDAAAVHSLLPDAFVIGSVVPAAGSRRFIIE